MLIVSSSPASLTRVTTLSPATVFVSFNRGVSTSIRPPVVVLNTRTIACVFRSISWCTSFSCPRAGATDTAVANTIPPNCQLSFIRSPRRLTCHHPGFPAVGDPEPDSIELSGLFVEALLQTNSGSSRFCGPWIGAFVKERLQRLVADVENVAGLPLVSVAAVEDKARVAGAPAAQRVVAQPRCGRWSIDPRDLPGEILGSHFDARRKGKGPLDHPAQLPDIAWPLVGDERLDRLRRERQHACAP